MFGLFRKEIDNKELFEEIILFLIDLRAECETDDSEFDAALKNFPERMKLRCDSAKRKMSPAQQYYTKMVMLSCKVDSEKIRSIVDQIRAILAITDPTTSQIHKLHSLKHDIDSIFRSHGASWNTIGLTQEEIQEEMLSRLYEKD